MPGLTGPDRPLQASDTIIFIALLLVEPGVIRWAKLIGYIQAAHTPVAIVSFVLLGMAPPMQVGREFVNSFHDTAAQWRQRNLTAARRLVAASGSP